MPTIRFLPDGKAADAASGDTISQGNAPRFLPTENSAAPPLASIAWPMSRK